MRIKDLNKTRGTNMRRLHEGLGIDWQAPYCEIEHIGKFTVKSMTKEMSAHGFTPQNSVLLALVQGGNTWNTADWNVVRIYDDGFVVDMPRCMDHYFRKGDFDNDRKKETCHAIFFAQKKEYLKGAKFTSNSWGGYYHHTKEIDKYGRFKDPDSVSRWLAGTYNPEIDPSGYCVDLYRSDLKMRAEIYKAEKAKEAYLKTDNTDKIDTLARLITEYKKKLSSALLSAVTSEDISAVDRALGWSGLYDIMTTFERFKEHTKNRSYTSIAASDRDYKYALEKCCKYLG